MSKALNSTDEVNIFGERPEDLQEKTSKSEFIKSKKFKIKTLTPGTPHSEKFLALFPKGEPRFEYVK